MVGYFDSDKSFDFTTYHKVASVLRDDCRFYAAIGLVLVHRIIPCILYVVAPIKLSAAGSSESAKVLRISQGSVATHSRCGGIFICDLVAS